MVKFFKNVKFAGQELQIHTGFSISGSRIDVMNALHNLAYIFRDRRVCDINRRDMSEAAKAIKAVITVKKQGTKP